MEKEGCQKRCGDVSAKFSDTSECCSDRMWKLLRCTCLLFCGLVPACARLPMQNGGFVAQSQQKNYRGTKVLFGVNVGRTTATDVRSCLIDLAAAIFHSDMNCVSRITTTQPHQKPTAHRL
ncbi:hypothetical protein BU25DRAFT_79627 [Macroventuria anomochaeta]|uniref:Uncharacterized protein n=1 Tax=Macroventuria anomochaeta TaxID=301207 RepID=A0ACB6SH98_9PLEO|nr:uncharacterized protein BU25DRAFT_79627 [Macroventuria anomochaeta]KAF2632649.1 hypothetical protein BU25DRAFT_79627 [Macroventuria anomochaeta]